MTKTCSQCGHEKARIEFRRHPRLRSGLQSACISCERGSRLTSQEKRLIRNRRIVETLKDNGCTRCGERHPHYVLELHHRDRSTKTMSIADAIFRMGENRLRAELAKCDVLCANCHRTVEWERGW